MRVSRRAFRLVGAAYCPDELAAFEVECHFAERRSQVPMKTIIRLGVPGPDGEIRRAKEKDATRIVANRPRRDCDWVVAVEMIPSEK